MRNMKAQNAINLQLFSSYLLHQHFCENKFNAKLSWSRVSFPCLRTAEAPQLLQVKTIKKSEREENNQRSIIIET